MKTPKTSSRGYFENLSKRRMEHAQFSNHVSDSIYRGQLDSLHDSITRLEESNDDLDCFKRSFELLKKVNLDTKFIINALIRSVGPKKGSPDEIVFRLFNLLFTFAALVERFTLHSRQEEDNVEASKISIQLWNDITHVISLSRKNHKDRKYTSRKTTSFRLSCDDIHDHFDIVMKSILFSLNAIQVKNGVSSYGTGDIILKKMISLGRCLVEFISAFGSNLDSVVHIEVLVRDVLLNILELDTNIFGRKDPKNQMDLLQLQTLVMECIIRILKWKQHSSRMLIKDTSCTQMNQKIPLRDRLLKCINQTLNSDVYHQIEHYPFLRNTCQCLTKLLENIYDFDTAKVGSKHDHSSVGHLALQIEVSYVFKWIHQVLQIDQSPCDSDGLSLKYCSLELLNVVIVLYPMSCAQFWALFLPQTRMLSTSSNQNTYSTKLNHRNVDLIALIDNDSGYNATSEERVLALKCCRQLIISLPLNLWSSTGYMNSRLEFGLGELIRITSRIFSDAVPINQLLQSAYALAEIIITRIPYDHYKSLTQPAVSLISIIGQNYTKFGLHGGTGLIENVITITECLGGKETPSGNATLLPLPSKIWLEGINSAAFLDRLYSTICEIASYESVEKGVEAILQMELFIRMVKIMPSLNCNDVHIDTFTTLTSKLLSSDDDVLQLTGSKLVRAYVEGRKNNHVNLNSELQSIPISVGIKMRNLIRISDSSVKCCVLLAYGSLRFCDWRILLFDHSNPLQDILPMCLECNEPNEKIRGEACKAIGNMISVCIKQSSSEHVEPILRAVIDDTIDSVLQVSSIAVHDSDANVRSMALFAIGNIALDISECTDKQFIHRLPLIQLCDTTYQRLFDDGEKVISNAIRTAGHLFHLLGLHDIEPALNENFKWVHLYGDFATELAKKIMQAIFDVLDSSESRTWKQRSGAKKHAWGACQTLRHIFSASAATNPANADGIHHAMDSLISCVFHCEKLNEKIVNGALNTLKHTDPSIWRLVSGKGLIGKCLVGCIEKLQSIQIPDPMKTIIHDIVGHLLNSSVDKDLLYFFEHCERSQIDFLYTWMVDHQCRSDMFLTCAKTLQSCQNHTFISIIQRFESRAIFESKKVNYLTNSHESGLNIYDDDEEDEL